MNENISRWIEQEIAAPTPKWYVDEQLFNSNVRANLPKDKRAQFRYKYVSINRPISYVWAKALDPKDVVLATSNNGRQSLIFSKNPLSLETIYQLELQPVLETRGQVALEYAQKKKIPLEFAKPFQLNRHVMTAIITRSVSGKSAAPWRATYFEEKVGATGHEEGKDPETLIGCVLSLGYARFAPGLTEEITKTFTM
jgi:hypothetical protein